MNNDKNDLVSLIDFINDIANLDGNEWFKKTLLDSLSKEKSFTETKAIEDIKKNTTKIVDLLEINPDISIDYSFISHKLLRTRLELDNLRMENVRYDLKEKEEMKRLYDFCINAFYQIENLINYFYFEKYPKIEDLLDHLEQIESTKFQRKYEKNVGDITIATKIFSFNKTYFNQNESIFEGLNIDNLRLIRNEGLHRCTRIKNIENENKRLHQFIKFATFDSIHASVNTLALKIKELLNK
jgi:hypothetical protein